MLTSTGKSFISIRGGDTDTDTHFSAIDTPLKPSKISPYNFHKFVPWICTQWCASTTVIITQLFQEKYVRYDHRKPRAPRFPHKSKLSSHALVQPPVEPSMHTYSSSGTYKGLAKLDILNVQAYYDEKHQLVEIAIVGPTTRISRRVIHAFNLCVPYHYLLKKISIRKGGLTSELIYEIDKLLPLSHITELCFDDSDVKEGNYYIFLEKYSQLQILSLNRCRINDEVCKRIFMNLDFDNPAAKTLQVLELGSNAITDVGAIIIAKVLKMNRCLLHLNLSGNKITDKGFRALSSALQEFPLTCDENTAARARRAKYLRDKIAVYEKCFYEIKHGITYNADSATGKKTGMSPKRLHKRKNIDKMDKSMLLEYAESLAKEIAGEFIDPYSPENVVCKKGIVYCKGNMILCSLNMAYNDLEFPSVQRLHEVIVYQSEIDKQAQDTGLIRITLDGNNIPSGCWELGEINAYLSILINGRLPSNRKTKSTTSSKSVN